MPSKSLHFCNHQGCNRLTVDRFCPEHAILHDRVDDKRRGTSRERGYSYKWDKYSKAFLSRPENAFCKLHLPGCTLVADCVDHIKPHNGPSDPLFWEPTNHQAVCLHCNSVKGNKTIIGEYEPIGEA